MGWLLVLVGGIMQGSFPLPLKLARKWPWENTWLVFSLVGLIAMPWALALAAIPALLQVYGAVSLRTLFLTGLFGFAWGIANVLFGRAVGLIGMALSVALVVGLSAALGSLVPLVVLTPEKLATVGGPVVIVGLAMAVLGVAILGVAGRQRERVQGVAVSRGSASWGLQLCILAGILAPMLNFSFAFGSEIAEEAAMTGASSTTAAYSIWAIALAGGCLSNGGYSLWLLARNKHWDRFFRVGCGSQWLLAVIMAILWTGGIFLYGKGASLLGQLGPVVGWPVFMAAIILTGNALGLATHEWDRVGRSTLWLLGIGLALLIVAIVVLSLSSRF